MMSPTTSSPTRTAETQLSAATIPHDCAPETLPAPRQRSTGPRRQAGIDIARVLALLGMIAVHLLSDVTADGNESAVFVLAAGNSAALFAVLAGVGIAFTTGRTSPPTGRRWAGAMAEVAVRGLLIGLLGLVLGMVVPYSAAAIILPYYGMMFVLAVPFLRLPPALLAATAVVLAIAMPILSHVLRDGMAAAAAGNPTLPTLLAAPGATMEALLLTGVFPALPWLAYVVAGMAVGRAALGRRGVMLRIAFAGIGLALLSWITSTFLLDRLGGREALAAVAMPSMSRNDFTDLLVWGAAGTLPTDSPWWLAVLAPHTTTPFDLLFTMGVALTVIGLAMAFVVVAEGSTRGVARLGTMPLSVYTGHLLLLAVPFLPAEGTLAYLMHLVLLGGFVVAWTSRFRRGPLEQALWWVAAAVDRFVGGPAPRRSLEPGAAG